MATPSKVDSILLKEHAKAFMLPGLPVNPRPFLRMLDQCVKEQGTDFIKTPEAKGLLFTLMLQAYNGLIPHDIWEAMNKVKEAL